MDLISFQFSIIHSTIVNIAGQQSIPVRDENITSRWWRRAPIVRALFPSAGVKSVHRLVSRDDVCECKQEQQPNFGENDIIENNEKT